MSRLEVILNYEISVSKGYLAEATGVVFNWEYYFDPVLRYETDRKCQEYIRRELSDIQAFYTESNLGRLKYYDSKQMLVGGIQPNMILGMLLGADFIAHDKMDADIAPVCWAGKDLDTLPAPSTLLEHELVRLFDCQILEVQKDYEKTSIPPFFWDSSGRPAIHGAVTTAQKFLGEQIFIDMLTEPGSLRQMTNWVVDAYIVLIKHFAELASIEIASVHVGECSSCMIGADQFNEFVVPGLNRIGKALGPVRLHSCGQSNHILEACKANVPALCSLDLGGESSLARVRELFGREFSVSIAPPAKEMSMDSPEAALRWLDRVLRENDNGVLTILCHIEPEYSLETVRALVSKIR